MNPSRIGAILSLCLVMGCSSIEKQLTDPSYHGPFRTDYNCGGAGPAVLKGVRRVAVLPTATPEFQPSEVHRETARLLHSILLDEIRSSAPFEAVPVFPDTHRLLEGADQLRVTAAIPPQVLKDIRQQTEADTVLFSSLTAYRPYPPILVGLKVSLVRIDDGAILWQFDDAWNAGDAPTLNDARRFFREKLGVETEPPPSPSMSSPSRFMRYSASVVVQMYQKAKNAGPGGVTTGESTGKRTGKR